MTEKKQQNENEKVVEQKQQSVILEVHSIKQGIGCVFQRPKGERKNG